MSTITAEKFVATWDTPLVILPRELAPPVGATEDTVEFLARGGLPRGLAYREKAGPTHLSFACLARGLAPLPQWLPRGIAASPSWAHHLVLGEEWFEGGASPLWCVHAPSGRVEVVDVESDSGFALLKGI